MANIRIKDPQKGSPKAEVGEIDTRAPFQSVKAAVSLFGEVAVSSKDKRTIKRTKQLSSENVLEKETQLLLAQKELSKIKQQLQSSESTKSRALSELEKAKQTQEDLTAKLCSVNQSMKSAMDAAEVVKVQAKKLEVAKSEEISGGGGCAWKQELDYARNEYTITVAELDASKQELTKIRQDFDAALEAKLAAFQLAAEAQRSANLNGDRLVELSKQIAAMHQSIEQLKHVSMEAQQEQVKILAEKEARFNEYKTAKEEAERNLAILQKEIDPELTISLEEKLKETTAEIEVLQEKMKEVHASEMDTVRALTVELNEATRTLQKISEEESSLRILVSSLRLEVENVKREREELNIKLDEEEKLLDAKREQILKLQQLQAEAEASRQEAEQMKGEAAKLKRDAEASRSFIEEAEIKLQIVQKEAEEAKEAEKKALEEMKSMSGKHKDDSGEGSEPTSQIKLTVDEFESLSRKVRESKMLAEKEEANSIAEVEVINARQSEVTKKLEANLKAIEEIKIATEMALKGAEMAETAKIVVEGELRRWRQEEEKVAPQVTSGHIYF
ncbi:WEB family protein At1g12150-like [Benincasa hispida]|uniref:WEB family protein At1g12150-like n=1 Tax=Benincasa hispida TaxID=102211 RepID=UPI001900FFBF|nr:WEB family protein At1g12150-like [Benincasa hispida]